MLDVLLEASIAPVAEGVNIDTLKIYFSDQKDYVKDTIESANTLYKARHWAEAKKKYQEAQKGAEELKEKVVGMKNNAGSTILSWLIPQLTAIFAIIPTVDGAIVTRKLTTPGNLSNALDETMTYNAFKVMAVANFNKLINWCKTRIKQCEHEMKTTGKR